MQILRTPAERFADIPDYPFAENWFETDLGDGLSARMHYIDEGPRDAPPVLLFHGEPSWSFLYRKMIPGLLATGRRVIAVDLVGCGRSDKPAAKDDYTLARHYDWMGKWLTAMDLRHITLFCQDWGGTIGLYLVAEHPERFDRVVAANTGLPIGEGESDFMIPTIPLIFDNDDHKLAGEFANFSEVSIKRKVDRDAQSTYSLNGTKVRRKDITDVFLGTGLGARSYSIIEQGMVSNLIESKPEELRVFIEEAAGISKYKERRRETESRIKRTKDNLNRLADIREELGRQLSHLQRQSIAAEKYEDLKKNERSLKANLDALNWAELDTEIKGIQRLVGDDEVIIDASVASQLEVDAEIENRLVQSSALSDLLEEVQARFYDLGNNVARVEQSIEHHKEKTQKIEEDLFESKNSFERIQKELNVDLRRITALEQRLIEVAPSLEMARATEKASSESLQKTEVVLQDWQDHWEKNKSFKTKIDKLYCV